MTKKIEISPLTRIEGHLAIHTDVLDGKVIDARCAGEMFRGFEQILIGRHPMDAQQITQRICGVCPLSHGVASVIAQEQVYNIELTKNGNLIRNIMLAANYIQSHLIHFYHLSAIDFIDITAILKYHGKDRNLNHIKAWVNTEIKSNAIFPVAPLLPRYEGKYLDDKDANIVAIKNYLDAFEMRRLAHQLVALWGGKMPHVTSLIPGGVTEKVTSQKIASSLSLIVTLIDFIDTAYINDTIAVAKAFPEYFDLGQSYGNFLVYGVFPEIDKTDKKVFEPGVILKNNLNQFDEQKIMEHTDFSYYSDNSPAHPFQGRTIPFINKKKAYSWIKSPRYDGQPMEVGPLARILVAYYQENKTVKPIVDKYLKNLSLPIEKLNSAMGRHFARTIECQIIAKKCTEWITMLNPKEKSITEFSIKDGKGIGLTEAPRGALGHWIEVENGKIKNYQCVVPTTWNASPRDINGVLGPIEKALIGTPVNDGKNPLCPARVVRSYDPCLACAVH